MSLLGVAYVDARIKEAKEERIKELKIKVFYYAIRHRLLYNDVLDLLKNNAISLNDLDS